MIFPELKYARHTGEGKFALAALSAVFFVQRLYGGPDTGLTLAFTCSVIQLRKQRYISKYQRVTPLRVAEKKIIY
jgi:hypothetical protein